MLRADEVKKRIRVGEDIHWPRTGLICVENAHSNGRVISLAAMQAGIDVLAAALFARFRSRVEVSFADQMLSAMRKGFGGHVEMPQ